MKTLLIMFVCTNVAIACSSQSAFAIKPFSDVFVKKYVDGNENKEFVEAVTQAKCDVCHIPGNKKEHNIYGKALADLLDKKADAKNEAKINDALDAVAGMKAPDGEKTFGDLIKQGKLPGGDPN